MLNLFIFILGLLIGAGLVFLVNLAGKKKEQELLMSQIKESLGAASFEAMSKNSEEFLKMAKETMANQSQITSQELQNKKELIDQSLNLMKHDLRKATDVVIELEKDREKKYGEISNQLKVTAQQNEQLRIAATDLKNVLSNSKIRGQWGERMAEDILRLAGFIEGVNYQKQKVLEKSSGRPDFTFFLPQKLKVNMDVKFPLDNYLLYLQTQTPVEKNNCKTNFLKDVRNRIKEVTTRDYINPAENTVDYVIVFIPNEQVYSFINENDPSILDESLKNKVVLCSPLTLYAILAVIRQAVDNFNMEKTATKILSLIGAFNKQWEAFANSFDKMGQKIGEAQKEYDHLLTTRRRQLERSLNKIEDLRKEEGIESGEKIKVES